MRSHKRIAAGKIIILLLCSAGWLFAEENADVKRWNVKVGSKGAYNTGMSEAYSSYSIYSEAIVDIDWLKCTVNGAHDFSSQISSGLGEYQYIDINKGSLQIEVSPFGFLSAGAGYYAARGNSSYALHEWDGFLRVGPDTFNLECAYGASESSYLFNGVEIGVKRKSAFITLTGDITDELSFDISYDRSTIEFSNLAYEYIKNAVRTSIFFQLNDSLFLSGGISGGSDSADYVILGADAGIFVVLCSHFQVSCMYFFEQYLASESETTNSLKKGNGGSQNNYTKNPYLQSSKIGESFPAHRIRIGIVYSVQ
ncbi:MAG: hypothetical protein N2316_13925 [Spirochaetes bacterium]|nr:hypothetical protein [Spirochaetota bacterium]